MDLAEATPEHIDTQLHDIDHRLFIATQQLAIADQELADASDDTHRRGARLHRAAIQAVADALRAEAAPLLAEYHRRPWATTVWLAVENLGRQQIYITPPTPLAGSTVRDLAARLAEAINADGDTHGIEAALADVDVVLRLIGGTVKQLPDRTVTGLGGPVVKVERSEIRDLSQAVKWAQGETARVLRRIESRVGRLGAVYAARD